VNLLLLFDDDFRPDGSVRLTGRRLAHARTILGASPGTTLRVGKLGGLVGEGRVVSISDTELHLTATLEEPPPPRPGIDLLVAVPRPKVLRRVLASAASLGVDSIVLVNARRVEKCYFDTHVLSPASVAESLCLGLEQAKDTRLPDVLVKKRFRPFVEDEQAELFGDADRFVLHPTATETFPPPRSRPRAVLAIGPEGGFVPFEVDLLAAHGFRPCTLGPRPLRVEVVIPYALGALAT
jgi:RsmE family RNA methyltransferase